MLPRVALLVVKQQVAADMNVRPSGEMVPEHLDGVDHIVEVELGFRHGLPVPARIFDFACPPLRWDRRHDWPPTLFGLAGWEHRTGFSIIQEMVASLMK